MPFFVVAFFLDRAGQELRLSGGRTTGIVSELVPDTRATEGAAYVDYKVGGAGLSGQVDLGADVDSYQVGQRVVVHYDRAHPPRMTIDGVDNQSTVSVRPMILVLLFGLGSVPGGGWMRWRVRRVHRLLAAGRWEPVQVSVRAATKGRIFTIFSVAEGSVWQSRTGWPTPNRDPRKLSGWGLPDEDPATVAKDQAAWWVSDGRFAVLSPDRGKPLVVARRR